MPKLTLKNVKEINRLRSLFPDYIKVDVARAEEGGYVAEIKTYPGCFTQGESFAELILMVNDCLYAYFDIPEEYVRFMPEYMAPFALAEKLGITPVTTKMKSIPYERIES